jgi:predicted acyl esterase
MRLSGLMNGSLNLTINKSDVDVGVVLYEVMPDGKLFHLGYFIGRASHARDMTRRQLLTPGRKTAIPFETGRMVSRQLSKGSRLLVTLNINMNPHAQVNHGTGKDVSDESIADAGAPLRVKWHNDSFVELPLHRSVEAAR